jgi:hypothetical protein
MSEAKYQIDAADELVRKTKISMQGEACPEIALRACVGSGKEVIASAFVKKMIAEEPNGFFFLWLVVGGSLRARNTANEVKELLGPSAAVVDYAFDIRDSIVKAAEPGMVAFSDFESFVSEDKNDPFEGIALPKGVKAIVVIDESAGAVSESDKASVLAKGRFAAAIRMAPEFKKAFDPEKMVYVRTLDAINEGAVRHSTVINEGLMGGVSFKDEAECIVSALSERRALSNLYSSFRSKVNPLCVILASGKEAERAVAMAGAAGEECEALPFPEGDEQADKMADLQKKNGKATVLVADYASLAGIPIARAQVLVDVTGKAPDPFDMKRVAIVSRAAERKKYQFQELNSAFVYTTLSVKPQDGEIALAAANVVGGRIPFDRSLYDAPISLPSYYDAPEPPKDIAPSFAANVAFELGKCWDEHLFNLADDCVKASLLGLAGYGSDIAASAKDKRKAYESAIMRGLGRYATDASLATFENAAASFFRERLHCDEGIAIACILNLKGAGDDSLSAESLVADAVSDYDSGKLGFSLYENGRPARIRDWRPPEKQSAYLINEEIGPFAKSLYKPSYGNLSPWKRSFIEAMEKDPKVKWFLLNRPVEDEESFLVFYSDDINDDCSSPYDYQNGLFVTSKAKAFAPDFVVRLSDGRILVVDVKRPDDGSDKTYLKALGLYSYGVYLKSIGRRDVVCGVATVRGGTVFMTDGLSYASLSSGRTDWKPFGEYVGGEE